MVHRGAAERSGPARSERGPRRAAPAKFRMRWAWRMPEQRRHRVVALGNGRYRVSTTIITTEEREVEVDEVQLLEMGIQPPALDLPWTEPTKVHAVDRAAALQHWTKRLGGYHPRLRSGINDFLVKYGLEVVKQAIDQVADRHLKGGASMKFDAFVRVLQQITERRDAK